MSESIEALFTTTASLWKSNASCLEQSLEDYSSFGYMRSVLYGRHSADSLRAAREQIEAHAALEGAVGFVARELVLVMCSGEDYHCWDEVARFEL